MSLPEVMTALAALGNAQTKKTYQNHGAPEPLFGVRIGDLKPLQKQIKRDHALALALYDTGNSDARYLAGLIADDAQMTPALLDHWAHTANWYMLAEYTVAWTAAQGPHGWSRGQAWTQSPHELVAAAGWSTLAGWVALKPDYELDLPWLAQQLEALPAALPQAANRTRYAMNGFVIAVGCYVAPLTTLALETAHALGTVQVNMGRTACRVPHAPDYIQKTLARGPVKKRKEIKC